MRRVRERIGVFCVIGLLLLVSACSLKSIRKEAATAPNGTETTAFETTVTPKPTSRPTAKPTQKPTPTPTQKPTPTPTKKPNPVPTPTPTPDPLADYFLQEGFLLKDVSAKDTDGKDVLLKTGTLICIFSREKNIIDDTSRFFLTDSYSADHSDISGKEVFFEVSENRLGAVCFSGIPEHELFGNQESVESGKRTVIEVDSGTQIKQISETERYVMRIDWDQDGYEDEVTLEVIKRYEPEVMCYFKSGKDGCSIRTRITPNLDPDYYDIGVSAETLLLTQKLDGGYVVLLCNDLPAYISCSFSMETWALSYGEEDVFAKKNISGLFEYQDGVLYQGSEGRFFAWYTKTKTAIQLNEDLSCKDLSGKHYFLNYGDPVIYLLQNMQVQIQNDTRYVVETLPAGTFIIPERMEISSSGESFFYFSLLDGCCARLQMEESQETQYFDGKPYYEVFYFIVCG